MIRHAEQHRSRHHRPDFIKIFLDGVPPTRSGAFLEPYLPDDLHGCDHRGHTTMDPTRLQSWLISTAERGKSAKFHCTGDASARMVLDVGATLACGSDWPVAESPNPWEAIYGLVTRRDPSSTRPGALCPEQAITLQEAMTACTSAPVEAMGLGAETGRLTPGLSADFIVLDRSPYEVHVEELPGFVAEETWFAGEPVHIR